MPSLIEQFRNIAMLNLSDEDNFDSENLVIKDVNIMGVGVNKNGIDFTERALKQTAKLLQDKAIGYVGHSGDSLFSPERKVTDITHTFSNVKYDKEKQQIRGDLHFIKGVGWIEQDLFPRMQQLQNQIGLSTVVYGIKQYGEDDEVVVDTIQNVESVDIVTTPACCENLFNSHKPLTKLNNNDKNKTKADNNNEEDIMTLEELKEKYPEIVKVLSQEALKNHAEQFKKLEEATALEKANAELKIQVTELSNQISVYKAAEEKRDLIAAIDQQWTEAKLDNVPNASEIKNDWLEAGVKTEDIPKKIRLIKDIWFKPEKAYNPPQSDVPKEEQQAQAENVANDITKNLRI